MILEILTEPRRVSQWERGYPLGKLSAWEFSFTLSLLVYHCISVLENCYVQSSVFILFLGGSFAQFLLYLPWYEISLP